MRRRHDHRAGNATLVNLLVLVVTTSLLLLLLEGLVRWRWGHRIVLFPRNHTSAQYGDYVLRTMIPHSVFSHESIDGRWRFQINNKGFRDTEDYAYAKPPGVFRVLVMGDSHTAGFEVSQHETYAAVLEELLVGRGLKAEVLNAGVSGLGTAEQLAYLEQEGYRYAPDAVVVGFFANDFSDSARAGLFRLEQGRLIDAATHYAPAVDVIRWVNAIPGCKRLSENSYLFSMAFNAAWDAMKGRSVREASREFAVRVGDVGGGEQDLVIALLKRLGAFAKSKGIRAVLADLPEVQRDGTPTPSVPPAVRTAIAGTFDATLWSETFLAGRPPDQRAHVPHGQGHLNAYGHRRLAEALAGAVVGEVK